MQTVDTHGKSEAANGQVRAFLPNSNNSAGPSSNSKQHFRGPLDAKDLAAQASFVATLVLNGEIDLEVARIYSTLVRTAAQGLGLEMQRGRMVSEKPDLSLKGDFTK